MHEADTVLSEAVAAGAVPGVVAIAATPDRVIYEGAFGVRRLGEPAPMTLDTVFRIASMTKAITAAAAMQLVEQGKLALDQPAREVVPELGTPQVLEGFAADGKPQLRPARGEVTLRTLLTHSSGFGYDVWNADLCRYHRETGLPAPRSGKLASLKAPLTFDPGTRWQYSIGIDWAGRMVEAVAGADLETVFQNRIFAPLGMTDTSYLVRPAMAPRLATVHARRPEGLVPVQLPSNTPREFFPGGGGLHSTARDYMRFLQMLLRGGAASGARVLAEATVRDMLRNHLPAGVEVEPMRSSVPESSNDVEFFPGVKKGWGLSFLINEEAIQGARSAGSVTWAGINNTYYWLDPVRQVAGAIFTPILPFGDPIVLGLLDRFERAVYRIV
ncbi:MAG TPA: serine hydrolase domain-containing protein [Acetobacteraceae bacterium]|nr:serine hydrolase domain-containing protein [Acetobacteraceae bacterium]